MKYFKNEYPNNIIIFDQDTNKVVCRLMHYDFNNEEEATQQAEIIVNSLNETEKETKDLFENYEAIPDNVKSILAHYEDLEAMNYEELAGLQKNLETIGYTFDYGLDAQPFNLRKI